MRSLKSILGGFRSCRNHPQILCATLWMESATPQRRSRKFPALKSIMLRWNIQVARARHRDKSHKRSRTEGPMPPVSLSNRFTTNTTEHLICLAP